LIATVPPAEDPSFQLAAQSRDGFGWRWHRWRRLTSRDRAGILFSNQLIIAAPHPLCEVAQFADQSIAIAQSVEPSDGIQRIPLREAVRLAIVDHLQAVFERAQAIVAKAQLVCVLARDQAGFCQCVQRSSCATDSQTRIAPAMDQLVCLREELDLTDAAATTFEIKSRARLLQPIIIEADLSGEPANLRHRTEIEIGSPHE